MHMALPRKAESVNCNKALMVVEVSFYGVWPASMCSWDECFPVEQSRYQVAMLLWLMEICRRSDISFYIETVYDHKWYERTNELDPRFVRVWVPIEDQLRLSQFLQQAGLSFQTATENDRTTGRKRKVSSHMPVEDEETTDIGHEFINSKYALTRAIMHNFMGLQSRSILDIDFEVPADDDEPGPLSPIKIWSAQNMFEDSLYQNRWENDRVAAWQRDYSSYVSADGMFLIPPQAQHMRGVLRQINANAPWLADRTGPSINVIKRMAMPHNYPTRIEVEDKLRENARASGNHVGPFDELSDDEFWDLFSEGDGLSGESELLDPVNFSPIEFRPQCLDQEYNPDRKIMEELYMNVLQSQMEALSKQNMIKRLYNSGQIDAEAAKEEMQNVKELICHRSQFQMQGPCDNVPSSFSLVFRECIDKLMPSMKQSWKHGGPEWELFSMNYAHESRDSALTDNALMTIQKIEMAASAEGLDLAQPQVMVWFVLFAGVMQLLALYWNRIQQQCVDGAPSGVRRGRRGGPGIGSRIS